MSEYSVDGYRLVLGPPGARLPLFLPRLATVMVGPGEQIRHFKVWVAMSNSCCDRNEHFQSIAVFPVLGGRPARRSVTQTARAVGSILVEISRIYETKCLTYKRCVRSICKVVICTRVPRFTLDVYRHTVALAIPV